MTARPTSCDKLRSWVRSQAAGPFYLEIRRAEKRSALRFIVFLHIKSSRNENTAHAVK